MSISSRSKWLVFASVIALAGAAAHCGPSGSCLRFSDCAEGLTCGNGKCVKPAPAAPAQDSGTDASALDGASPTPEVDAAQPPTDDASSIPAEDAGDEAAAAQDAGDLDTGTATD